MHRCQNRSWSPFGWTLFRYHAVQTAKQFDFVLRIPGNSLAAVPQLFHQGPQCGKPLVQVWIVPLYYGNVRHGFTGHWVEILAFPVAHIRRLRHFSRRIMENRHQHDILFNTQHLRRNFGKFFRYPFKNIPVTPGFQAGSAALVSGWINGCMSDVFRSFFSYHVAVGNTISE